MADTMMTMVMGAKNADIVYNHVYKTQTFTFSTQEIKEVLGDVPLDNMDVLLWIKGYVDEGLASIMDAQ